VVAHEDVDALDAKVRLRLRAGNGAGGHAGDYKTGRGSEEKDNAEARGAERRAEDEKRKQVPRSARDDGLEGRSPADSTTQRALEQRCSLFGRIDRISAERDPVARAGYLFSQQVRPIVIRAC
jgi:hypothetical protein